MITENEKKDSAIRIAKTSATDADAAADQAKRDLAQIESAMNNLRIELNKDAEDAKIQAQAERAALLQQLDMANIKIRDRDETIRKLTRDIVEIQTRAESNEAEIRRAHLNHVSGIKKRLADTELAYQDSISKRHGAEKLRSEEEESHKAEMSSVRSELDRVRREKEALHDKLRESEHSAESERRKIAVLRRKQPIQRRLIWPSLLRKGSVISCLMPPSSRLWNWSQQRKHCSLSWMTLRPRTSP